MCFPIRVRETLKGSILLSACLVLIMGILSLTAFRIVDRTGDSDIKDFTALKGLTQEGMRIKEILQWFPSGNYQNISHKDFAGLEGADAYVTFKRLFSPPNFSVDKVVKQLPDFLKNGIKSITVATIDKVKVHKTVDEPIEDFNRNTNKLSVIAYKSIDPAIIISDPPRRSQLFNKDGTPKPGIVIFTQRVPDFYNEDGSRKPETEGLQGSQFKGDLSVSFVHYGGKLSVVRYDNLETLIKQAAKGELLIPIKAKIAGRPVYQVTTDKDKSGYYLYPTETGELIMADKVTMLKDMFAAWSGEDQGVLSDPDLSELLVLEQELGQIWELSNVGKGVFEVALEHYRNKVESDKSTVKEKETAETIISNLENALEKVPLLFSVTTYKISDQIRKSTYELCSDENVAREKMKRDYVEWGFDKYLYSYNAVGEAKEFYDALDKAKKIELDETLITVSAIVDKDLLKLARTATRKIREMEEELKKEKEEREKINKSQ